MAREVLPIVGATVDGYFGPRLSWWRRALIWLAHAGLKRGGYVGDGNKGQLPPGVTF